MKYYSRVSIGLIVFIALCLIISIAPVFFSESSTEDIIAAVLSGLAIVPIMMFGYYTTHYTISGNTLIVKSFLIVSDRIDISTIKSIQPSRSLLSAPAMSLRRICIKYGRFHQILISPKNQVDFLKQLQAINPNIEIAKSLLF